VLNLKRRKEITEHEEHVLITLNHLFCELTKDILKVYRRQGVRKDLENVEIHFEERKPCFTVNPDRTYWNPNSC